MWLLAKPRVSLLRSFTVLWDPGSINILSLRDLSTRTLETPHYLASRLNSERTDRYFSVQALTWLTGDQSPLCAPDSPAPFAAARPQRVLPACLYSIVP